MPGQTLLNRYYIERQLGQRLGRLTLLVTDQETRQRLVLKVLSFGSQFDWQDHKLFEREAALLKAVKHPAIPQYVDFFDLDLPDCRGFVLAQSYIDAPSLQEWMQLGRSFSTAEVQQIAQAVLQILLYLHSQHPPIIHRDIKPSNILLSDRTGNSVGSVYLVDFGAVQTLASSGTQTVVGSYGYMPMEQFGGRAVSASDLYSLGATLVELLTGRHPADLLDEQHQLQLHLLEVPPILASWLGWLTQPHSYQRPLSTQVALDALQAIPQAMQLPGQKDWVWQLEQKRWVTRVALSRRQQPGVPRRQQPQGSQVVLQQLPDHISVTFPDNDRVGAGCLLMLLGSFSISWNSFLAKFLWERMAASSMTTFAEFLNILGQFIWTVPFWIVGLYTAYFFIAQMYELLLLKQTQAKFYSQHVSWHKYYRLGHWHWQHSRQTLTPEKLVYVPTHFCDDDNRRYKIDAQLELHLGASKELIDQGLSELEMQWLAQELSEKLDIPYEHVQKKNWL
ncbi:MAG TPA: serine/threonine-protein kinase [Trichocoleus sp.]